MLTRTQADPAQGPIICPLGVETWLGCSPSWTRAQVPKPPGCLQLSASPEDVHGPGETEGVGAGLWHLGLLLSLSPCAGVYSPGLCGTSPFPVPSQSRRLLRELKHQKRCHQAAAIISAYWKGYKVQGWAPLTAQWLHLGLQCLPLSCFLLLLLPQPCPACLLPLLRRSLPGLGGMLVGPWGDLCLHGLGQVPVEGATPPTLTFLEGLFSREKYLDPAGERGKPPLSPEGQLWPWPMAHAASPLTDAEGVHKILPLWGHGPSGQLHLPAAGELLLPWLLERFWGLAVLEGGLKPMEWVGRSSLSLARGMELGTWGISTLGPVRASVVQDGGSAFLAPSSV